MLCVEAGGRTGVCREAVTGSGNLGEWSFRQPRLLCRLRTCVGTGPFRWKQYVRGQVIELERNPDYFVPAVPILTACAT